MSWVQSRVDLLRQIAVVFCVCDCIFFRKKRFGRERGRTLWLWRKAWTGSALLAETTAADDVQQQVKDIQSIVCVFEWWNFEIKKIWKKWASSASTYLYERERNEQWWDLWFLSWSSNVSWHLNDSINQNINNFLNCWFFSLVFLKLLVRGVS